MLTIRSNLARSGWARAAAVALAVTAPAAVLNFTTAAPAVAQQGPDGEVDLETFYRELSPHGEWFEHSRWGEVWRPNVASDWRPYTRGHWAWTDEHGWYWVAEEEWGWAPFHYGRWVFDDDDGAWLWIPGYEWAPAWVQWRESEDAVGWAPLPPDSVLQGGTLQFNATAYDSPRFSKYWVFAPPALMFLPGLYRHIMPSSRHSVVWRSTRPVHFHHRYDRGRIFMPGVDHRRVERWAGRSVPAVTLRAVDSPRGYGWRNMQDRSVVPVYRPRVVSRPDMPRPQRPIMNPRGDRDRDGIPNWRDPRPNRPDPVIVRPGNPRGDRDRDGIPNWRDQRPNRPDPVIVRPGNPRDRDGDGRQDWRDQRPNRPDPVVRPGPGDRPSPGPTPGIRPTPGVQPPIAPPSPSNPTPPPFVRQPPINTSPGGPSPGPGSGPGRGGPPVIGITPPPTPPPSPPPTNPGRRDGAGPGGGGSPAPGPGGGGRRDGAGGPPGGGGAPGQGPGAGGGQRRDGQGGGGQGPGGERRRDGTGGPGGGGQGGEGERRRRQDG